MIDIPGATGVIMAKQAFICREEPVLSEVCDIYGRDSKDCAIKVFYGNPLKEGETLKDALWGDDHDPNNPDHVRKNTKLLVASRIHNICWWFGKSPRIYAVFEAMYKGERVACQLTEFLHGALARNQDEVLAAHAEVNALGKEYKFSEVKNLLSYRDAIDGKIIDMQQYTFDSDHEERIKQIYFESGKYGKIYYQPVPELGLQGGPRASDQRIKELRLDDIDFKGKIVWDIGSAGGFFCRYALSRGAKRVIGFDEEAPTFSAFMVSNYLEYFNIDYVTEDLRNGVPDKYIKPDIIFFLSMNYHISIPERIKEAELVIFEDNGKESRALEELTPPWTDWFEDIKFIGRALDHGEKSLYHLRKCKK